MTETEIAEALMCSRLFEGFTADEVQSFVSRQPGSVVRYKKKDMIEEMPGGRMSLACIFSGVVDIKKKYSDGTSFLLARKEAGELVGLTSVDTEMKMSQTHHYIIKTDTVLYRLNPDCFQNRDYLDVACHEKLLINLSRIISRELSVQYRQQEMLLTKSIRGKLITYLQEEQKKQGARNFDIPFTRSELAQRLYANRSALSREIGRMKRDGLIDVQGKHFVIKW